MLLRKLLSQFHWLVGISAGVILALVGITGALLSFEGAIVDWLNRDSRQVEAPAGQKRLSPPELLARIVAAQPDKRVTALAVFDDPLKAARVSFASPPRGRGAESGGGGRGEQRFANLYSGELLPTSSTGEKFFRDVRGLHRWLMLGELGNRDVGRQIVGACTVLLILIALTGLYLRWPGRHSLRVWLVPNFSLKGRLFLWNLHSTAGTWVLPIYLLMALTGLQWSYEWYRDGLYAMAGVERRAEGGPREPRNAGRDAAAQSPNIAVAWQAFVQSSAPTGYANVNINLGGAPAQPIEFRYLEPNGAHERAYSTLTIDADTGAVRKHERYAEKTFGGKLVSSVFPLHSGSFFGTVGVVLFLIASLAMPVFAVTGWMMYLQRRRMRAAEPASVMSPANS